MKPGEPKFTNHFFLPEDQPLFDYDYIFSASAMWVELGMEDVTATFDLFVRELPRKRNFLLFNGLEEMITGVMNWKFKKEDIDFLLKRNIIKPKLAKLLKNFKFDGEIWAMPEGSIFFPGEPVFRITGKLWQINLFTFFLMNSLSSNTIFASKLARCMLAANNKTYVATCSPVRGHAHEAALKFGRSAYLFGSASGMVPGFAKKFNIPFKSRARGFHAFIKSFPTEIEGLRAVAKVFPDSSVMVDTYSIEAGTRNAITVCLEQKKKGQPFFSALFIDSGATVEDFANSARYVRRELDQAGLKEVQITVAGNFEEYKIKKLVDLNAPVDKVILGTEAIAPADDPKLEVILKMALFKQKGKTIYTVKLASGKVSYPGLKQVYRTFNKQGKIVKDVIGLVNEKLGVPQLKKMVVGGKYVRKLPNLDELKDFTLKQLEILPDNLKRIDEEFVYPVKTSKKLEDLFQKIKKMHSK